MPAFVYNRNIPDGPNNPSVDQPAMKVNTNSIDDLINVDHFAFNDNNGGLHRKVSLVDPTNVPAGTALTLTTKQSGGQDVLWAQNSLLDTPLFTGGLNLNPNGFSSIYGGVILQWGSVINPGISGAVAFPLAFASLLTIQLTPQNNGLNLPFIYYLDSAPTGAGFTYVGTTATSQRLYWFAVGL